jgi:hypothetical protein
VASQIEPSPTQTRIGHPDERARIVLVNAVDASRRFRLQKVVPVPVIVAQSILKAADVATCLDARGFAFISKSAKKYAVASIERLLLPRTDEPRLAAGPPTDNPNRSFA